jgi:hypothetical protein
MLTTAVKKNRVLVSPLGFRSYADGKMGRWAGGDSGRVWEKSPVVWFGV